MKAQDYLAQDGILLVLLVYIHLLVVRFLEYSVNLSAYEIPKLLSFTLLEIPDNEIYEVNINDLPQGWNSFPAPTISRIFGNALLTGNNKAIIKIPSTIITKEFNYLLNPNHKNSFKFKIVDIEDFVYDDRINTV